MDELLCECNGICIVLPSLLSCHVAGSCDQGEMLTLAGNRITFERLLPLPSRPFKPMPLLKPGALLLSRKLVLSILVYYISSSTIDNYLSRWFSLIYIPLATVLEFRRNFEQWGRLPSNYRAKIDIELLFALRFG